MNTTPAKSSGTANLIGALYRNRSSTSSGSHEQAESDRAPVSRAGHALHARHPHVSEDALAREVMRFVELLSRHADLRIRPWRELGTIGIRIRAFATGIRSGQILLVVGV